MRKLLWDLFCKTGKIEYYLKYKQLMKGIKEDEEESKYRGDL